MLFHRWKLIVFAGLSTLCFLIGCASGGSGGSPAVFSDGSSAPISPTFAGTNEAITKEESYSTLKIGSSTFPLSTDSANLVTAVSADKKTLRLPGSDPAFAPITVGSVIVANITSRFPNGLIRKITKVTMSGSDKIVETENASIEEVFENGEAALSDIVQASEIEDIVTAPEYDPNEDDDASSSIISPNQSSQAASALGFGDNSLLPPMKPGHRAMLRFGNTWQAPSGFRPAIRSSFLSGEGFKIELSTILYDRDKNTGTTNDQVRMKGNLTFDPRLAVALKVENFKMKRFLFKVSFLGEANIKVGSDMEAKIEKTKELGRIKLSRKMLGMAGPVPIWIKPEIPINLNLSASAKASLYVGVTCKLEVVGGLEYDNGKWNILKKLERSFTFDKPEPEISFEVRAGVGPEIIIYAMDVAGPKLNVELYTRLTAAPLANPWLDLAVGFSGQAGAEIKIFSKTLFDYSATLFDWSKSLYSKTGPLITIPYINDSDGDGVADNPNDPIVVKPAGSNATSTTTVLTAGSLIPDPTRISLGIGMELSMVKVNSKTISMGGVKDSDKPGHSVTINKPFYLGKFEVTQAQYSNVTGEKPSYFANKNNFPVENVTWFNSINFCNTLSLKLGLKPVYKVSNQTVIYDAAANGFRLPTEAEWELASEESSTDVQLNSLGATNWLNISWIWENSLVPSSSYYARGTQEVGKKRANIYGLFDMRGNVAEWCWDWYGSYSASSQNNPVGPNSGTYRVVRGGSWDARSTDLSVLFRTSRGQGGPTSKNFSTGFRVARNAQ